MPKLMFLTIAFIVTSAAIVGITCGVFEHEWRLNRIDRDLKRFFPHHVDIAGIDKTVLLRELCDYPETCCFTAKDLQADSIDPRSYGKERFEAVVRKIKETK